MQKQLIYICMLVVGGLCLIPHQSAHAFDIDIEGVSGELYDNIALHLNQYEKYELQRAKSMEDDIAESVKSSMRAMGHYQPSVTVSTGDEKVLVTIDRGDAIVWFDPDVDFSNATPTPNESFQSFVSLHPFNVGETINHGIYETFKRSLLDAALSRGYLDAEYSQSQLLINIQQQQAQPVLKLAMGTQYRLQSLNFSGTDVNEELLHLLADVDIGKPYNADMVGNLYNNLSASGYFSSVNIGLEKDAPDKANLNITLDDAPEHRVSTGIGIGTDDDGLRFRANWNWTRLNQRGDSMDTQLKVSQVQQEVSMQYKLPWDHPQKEYLSFSTGWSHKQTDDLTTTRSTLGAAYNKLLGGGWQYSLHVDVENETSQLNNQREDSFTYIIPSVQVTKRSFQGTAADPRRGYKFWTEFGTSQKALGSETDFYLLATNLNTIYQIDDKHTVLTRLMYGYLWTSEFTQVPPSRRFFTGGDQTVRGFKFESITPKNLDGNPVGGQSLQVGSIEYRYRFLPKWQAAIFYDRGRVFVEDTALIDNSDNNTPQLIMLENNSQSWRDSAGIGIRWQTPVGPIAFDVAKVLDESHLADPTDNDIRVHLYLSTPL